MSALETRMKQKSELSDEIQRDVEAFLASGKQIREIQTGLSGEKIMGFNNQNLKRRASKFIIASE